MADPHENAGLPPLWSGTGRPGPALSFISNITSGNFSCLSFSICSGNNQSILFMGLHLICEGGTHTTRQY